MSWLQLKRGTAAAVAAYTPKAGEPVLDTTNYRLVLGDGTTLGGIPLKIATGTSGDNVPLLSGVNTWSNSQTFTASTTTFKAASGSTGIEIGSTTAAASAFIDFHSSGNNIDYDARWIVSGGSTTVGNANVSLTAATFSLSGVFTSTGVADASSAATGKVGEYLSATGSAVTLAASGTVYNLVSLSLTAGDWLISGAVDIIGTAALTELYGATTLTSATAAGFPYTISLAGSFTTAYDHRFAVPQRRLNVSATTTVYLIGRAGFASGSATGTGFIEARRIR